MDYPILRMDQAPVRQVPPQRPPAEGPRPQRPKPPAARADPCQYSLALGLPITSDGPRPMLWADNVRP